MNKSAKKATRFQGNLGESFAVEFLKEQGYRILERNFACKVGEIDIVAQEDDVLCFVEVRMRADLKAGYPYETVTRSKQRKLIRSALAYMQKRKVEDVLARFDVVSVVGKAGAFEAELIRNAFEVS